MRPLLSRQLALLLIFSLPPLFQCEHAEAFTRLSNPQRLAETPPSASLGDILLLGLPTASLPDDHQLDDAADVDAGRLRRLRKRLDWDSAVNTTAADLTTSELLPSPAEVSGVELGATDAVRPGFTERIDRRLSIAADLLGSSVLLSAAGPPITLASNEAPTFFLDLQHCAVLDEFESSCRVTKVQLTVFVAAAALLLLGLALITPHEVCLVKNALRASPLLALCQSVAAAAAGRAAGAAATAAARALGAPVEAQLQVPEPSSFGDRGRATACVAAAAVPLRHREAAHAAQLFLPAALAACEGPHAEGLAASGAVAAGKEETLAFETLVAGGQTYTKLEVRATQDSSGYIN
ncbi:hypothetical protein Esti_001854 [Eimeria stiedai]